MLIAPGATNEERLLVLASLAAPTDEERAQLSALVGGPLDWPRLFALAQTNATAPLLYRRLAREGLLGAVPTGTRDDLVAVAATVAATNERRLVAAKELLEQLHRAGIDCVVLKGMLFGLEVYGDPGYKRMNDIDILVRLSDVPAVMEIYRGADMFSSSTVLGTDATPKPHRSHHLPSFVSKDGALVVGTHWGLITPLSPYTIDYAAIWSRVRPIDFYGSPAFAMSHEDNLHHLCVHLPYYKTGVRELADIWNLVRHAKGRLDLNLFRMEMEKAGSHNLVFHALSLANRLVPDEDITTLADSARTNADRWYRYDVARKTRDVHTLLQSRSTHTSRIEKAYTEFNATSSAAEKLSAFTMLWSALLAAPAAEALKMSSLRDPSPIGRVGARIAAPYRLTKVFQRDLGRWLFFAALLKTVVDLAAAGCGSLIKANERRDTLDDFAARVGLKASELRAILESQE
jgi:Uncharacterised nucleotidyltransferase